MMTAQAATETGRGRSRPRDCLLLLFVLPSFVSCAVVRTWPYDNQPAQVPPRATHANYAIGDKENSDKTFVGLALSGGGSRAANFSAAVMLELKRRGILPRVDFISSVSGGSLPAAYYALEGYEYFSLGGRGKIAFEELEVKDRMGRNFQQRWVLSWFNPLHILRYWFTDFTRSDIMVPVFDSNLFHGATFADLKEDRPKLLINATDAGAYDRFTFSDESAAKIQSDLAAFGIARAVNISSAFPGAFQTITVKNYKGGEETYRHLYDGGPADNLGLDALADVLWQAVCGGAREMRDVQQRSAQQSVRQQSILKKGKCPVDGKPPQPITKLFPEGCLVISVDAAPWGEDRDRHRAEVRRWTDYIVDSNVVNATDVMLFHNRRATLEDFGIPKPKVDEHRFSTFSFDDKNTFCRFWHIALRHIPADDDVGKKVHGIETSFNIEDNQQQALFDAAKRLVDEGFTTVQESREAQEEAMKALLSQLPGTR